MQRLSIIQVVLLMFWRDLVSPGAGLYLLLVDPSLSAMHAWQAPVVASLLGFPLAARGLMKEKE